MDPPGRAPRRAGGCPRRGGRRRRESRRRESRRQVGVQVGVQVDVQVDVFALARRVRHQGGRGARVPAPRSQTPTCPRPPRGKTPAARSRTTHAATRSRRRARNVGVCTSTRRVAARRIAPRSASPRKPRGTPSPRWPANAPRTARSTGFEPTTSGRRRARILVSGTSRTGFEPTRGSSRFATRRREKICSARFRRRRATKERRARRENRRDAANAYRELLLERGVDANARWRDISAICADDPRSMKCDAEDRLETFAPVVGRLRDRGGRGRVLRARLPTTRRTNQSRVVRGAFGFETSRRFDGASSSMVRVRGDAARGRARVRTRGAKRVGVEAEGIVRGRAGGDGTRRRGGSARGRGGGARMWRRHRPTHGREDAPRRARRGVPRRRLRRRSTPEEDREDDDARRKKCDGVEKVEKVVEKVAGRRIDRIDVACGDAVATAKTAARRAARRKRRALEDFERLLDASRRASRSKTTWEDAERRLRDAPEWRRCCGDGGDRGEYLEDAKALFAARAVRLAAREADARAAMEEGEALRTKTKTTARGSGARASAAADDERTVRVRVEVAVEAKTTTTTAREDAGANEPDGAARGERRAA